MVELAKAVKEYALVLNEYEVEDIVEALAKCGKVDLANEICALTFLETE